MAGSSRQVFAAGSYTVRSRTDSAPRSPPTTYTSPPITAAAPAPRGRGSAARGVHTSAVGSYAAVASEAPVARACPEPADGVEGAVHRGDHDVMQWLGQRRHRGPAIGRGVVRLHRRAGLASGEAADGEQRRVDGRQPDLLARHAHGGAPLPTRGRVAGGQPGKQERDARGRAASRPPVPIGGHRLQPA